MEKENKFQSLYVFLLALVALCLPRLIQFYQEDASGSFGDNSVLEFSELVFNFGEIQEGEKVSHNFSFKNIGNSEAKILDVKSTCGCSVPYWPKEKILPGDENKISVTYDSRGRSGKQSKKLTVLVKEGGGKSVKIPLIIKATVKNPLIIQPRYILFNKKKRPEENLEQVVHVSLAEDVDQLELKSTEGDFFNAELKKVGQGEFELRVNLNSKKSSAAQSGGIVLSFLGKKPGQKKIPVRVIN